MKNSSDYDDDYEVSEEELHTPINTKVANDWKLSEPIKLHSIESVAPAKFTAPASVPEPTRETAPVDDESAADFTAEYRARMHSYGLTCQRGRWV